MNCRQCDRPTISQRTWDKASPAKRSIWLAVGTKMLQGRGLCRACYLRAYRAGEIPRRGRQDDPKPTSHPCNRCGIDTADVTCRDCRDVEVFA